VRDTPVHLNLDLPLPLTLAISHIVLAPSGGGPPPSSHQLQFLTPKDGAGLDRGVREQVHIVIAMADDAGFRVGRCHQGLEDLWGLAGYFKSSFILPILGRYSKQ
jgi:hypothetical protein